MDSRLPPNRGKGKSELNLLMDKKLVKNSRYVLTLV